jgi:hypothetical protein
MSDFAGLGIAANPYGRAEQRSVCPQCGRGPHDKTLGVNVETGVYHCFRCELKGRAPGEMTVSPVARINDPGVVQRKRERLRAVWRETVALDHPHAHAVRSYLTSRGLGEILSNPPTVLRAHPGLEYWDCGRSVGRFPAMVAPFHGAAGDLVTLHVTYLRADGCVKAPVSAPKKILGVPHRGATKGGAIRLYPVCRGVLGVAEGVETALSLRLIRNIPVWASFCADNLQRLRLPEGLRELKIGVDLDENGKGLKVAEALAHRVMRWSRHTKVTLIVPELDGPTGDLNDELRRRVK